MEKGNTIQTTTLETTPEPIKNVEIAGISNNDDNSQQNQTQLLISQALANNVEVETIEKLVAMKERVDKEYARKQFFKAMAQMQAEMPEIEKKKEVNGRYKYAPLESIVSQIKSLLAKYGFSYSFDTKKADGQVLVCCKVHHLEGHTEKTCVQVSQVQSPTNSKGAKVMTGAQEDGSTITYGKRYSFCNSLGIMTADEDTDGNIVEVPQQPYKKPSNIGDQAKQAWAKQEHKCSGCGVDISDAENGYSIKKFGKALCQAKCQKIK